MDTYKCNYHMHSYYSDGVLSPGQLVRKFAGEEYDVMSLTDHDGIEGVKEFLAACEAAGVKGISGIEFSTCHEYDGSVHEVHVLGYNFDPDDEEFRDLCADLKKRRRDRNVRLIAKLNELGYDISLEEIESQSKGRYAGKPNIARSLVSKGYFGTPKEVFEKLMDTPEIEAIKKEDLTAEEAIKAISKAGGQAFVAHPAKIKTLGERDTAEFWKNFEKLLKDLRSKGLKGLECFYPEHTDEEEFRFIQLAGKYHLHISSGTDYHGDDL